MGMITRVGSLVSNRVGKNSAVVNALRPAYERFLLAASFGRGISWPVNGEPMRIDPRVRRLMAQQTELDLWEYLRSAVGPAEQVLDIGSFLGVYAIMMARWSEPAGRVLAFEPSPGSGAILQRHLRMNGQADRVTLVRSAVGAEPGMVELREYSDPYRNAVASTAPGGVERGLTRVSVTTVDEVCASRGFVPTLMRIDVQGFELAVLRGARETIQRGRGRLRIVLEVHPQLWGEYGVDASRFDALLAELGLRAVPLVPGESTYQPDEHVRLEYV